jgi:hypothetical protein
MPATKAFPVGEAALPAIPDNRYANSGMTG